MLISFFVVSTHVTALCISHETHCTAHQASIRVWFAPNMRFDDGWFRNEIVCRAGGGEVAAILNHCTAVQSKRNQRRERKELTHFVEDGCRKLSFQVKGDGEC